MHVEYFGTKEAVAREKSELVRVLKHHDFAVLNHDNDLVRNMRGTTRSKVKTFGLSEGSDLRVSNFGYRYDNNNRIIGVTFKIAEGASFLPVNIGGSLGEAIALSSAAACAVGRILDMNLVQISEALVDFRGQPGRLRLLDGIKDSQIIDDTYNASPSATKLALKVLKEVRGNRKIGILGDMLELGEYTEMAHRRGKGIDTGGFPVNVAKEFLVLIKSAQSNAKEKELGEDLRVVSVSARKGTSRYHYGRYMGRKMKTSNVEVVLGVNKVVKAVKPTTKKSTIKKEEVKEQ